MKARMIAKESESEKERRMGKRDQRENMEPLGFKHEMRRRERDRNSVE